MADRTPKDLLDVIQSNCLRLVKACLDEGVSPNANVAFATPTQGENGPIKIFRWNRFNIVAKKPQHSTYRYNIKPLHIAIMNCYVRDRNSIAISLDIVCKLLTSKLCVGACELKLVYGSVKVGALPPKCTPTKIAMTMNRFQFSLVSKSEQNRIFESLIELIENYKAKVEPAWRSPTTNMPQSVADTYAKLFLSDKFCDIIFVCTTEAGNSFELRAHRNILAAVSPYFDTAFEGHWAENNVDGHWYTSHPPCILKAVLSYIYTGNISSNLLSKEYMAILSVASEFDIASLKKIAVAYCIRSLSHDNIKENLQASHLYESEDLKSACFKFVQRNAATVLTDQNILALITENPTLWCALTNAISGNKKNESKKRPRAT